jgi:hypothetical protein
MTEDADGLSADEQEIYVPFGHFLGETLDEFDDHSGIICSLARIFHPGMQ